MSDLICVGAITGAHGVRGEVRIKSFCAIPDAIETYSPLSGEKGQAYPLALIGPVKGGFRARIAGVDNKDQADALKGTRLYARRDQLPNLPDDEYYYNDLMGLTVFDTGGAELGRVKAVLDHGGQDVLEVALKGRSDTGLIPFTRMIVPTVDLNLGRLVVDAPDGMLP